MIKDDLRRELVAMRGEDMRVRDELMASGELGGPYVPRMEEVHKRNGSRLRELIELHGWLAEDIAEKDGCEAAWFIVQHSVGEPKFQRDALKMLQACVAEGRAPGLARGVSGGPDRNARGPAAALRYAVDGRSEGRARPAVDAS